MVGAIAAGTGECAFVGVIEKPRLIVVQVSLPAPKGMQTCVGSRHNSCSFLVGDAQRKRDLSAHWPKHLNIFIQ